jgi:hypothetical protein
METPAGVRTHPVSARSAPQEKWAEPGAQKRAARGQSIYSVLLIQISLLLRELEKDVETG